MIPIQKKITLVNRTLATSRKIEWIVIHYVGAVSTAENNVNYFYDKNVGKSAHYFIDENEIWQCVEEKDISWHENGELYVDATTIQNTIYLVRDIMKKYAINIENVVRHYDVTRKVCPVPFVEEESLWIRFKRRLEVMEITDVNEALKYLEEKGRVTSREYWEKTIDCVKNQEFVFLKWANDLKELLG